jgi:RES domain-containing protein
LTAEDARSLEALLLQIPARAMRRRLVRCVPLLAFKKGDPPDFLRSSGRPGRCNPRGVDCLYFSEGDSTANAEYRRAWRGLAAENQPRITFTARVSLRRVVDLAQRRALRTLGMVKDDLFESWRLRAAPTRLQLLGAAISRQSVIAALRYPSAAARSAGDSGWNVAIYPAALRSPDRVEILGDSAEPLAVLP